MKIEDVAAIAHMANRELCKAFGDRNQPKWSSAPGWMRDSSVDGVNFILADPAAGPEDAHENWCADKRAAGWTLGTRKDAVEKTHPCLVAFDVLPAEQRAKDHLFVAIVRACAPLVEAGEP